MAIELARITLLAAAGGMLCLAAALVAANPRRGSHLCFAALLGVRGMALLLPQLSTDPRWTWAGISLQPYFALAVAPLALLCLAFFPTTRPGSRRAVLAAVGVIAAVDIAYLLQHSLVNSFEPGIAATGALQAGPGLRYTAFGPLTLLAALGGPVLAVVAVRLGLEYRSQPAGPEARVVLLACAGLLLGAVFDGASRTVALADLLDQPAGFPWLPWGWTIVVLPALALPIGTMGLAVLVSGRFTQERPWRRLENLAVATGALLGALGLVRLLLPPESDPAGGPFFLLLLGVVRLLTPALIAYALLLELAPHAHAPLAWALAASILAGAAWALAMVLEGWMPAPLPVLAAILGAAIAATGVRVLVPLGKVAVSPAAATALAVPDKVEH